MLEENKLVKVQPAHEPVQRMEPEEELHELLEEEQMPGPERLKAEGKVDGMDQPPPKGTQVCRSIRQREKLTECINPYKGNPGMQKHQARKGRPRCTVTDSCAETNKRSAAD
eukprot:s5967_g3.t1